MKKLLILLAMAFLISSCSSGKDRRYVAGGNYTGDLYRLIILSYSGEKGALGAAVLDLEGDDMRYEPHPEEQYVKIINSTSFMDASAKAREILGRHCGLFTYTTTLLASPDNIPTGYEILPVIKENAYCIIGTQVSLNYQGPLNGTIILSLPKRDALPYTQDNSILR